MDHPNKFWCKWILLIVILFITSCNQDEKPPVALYDTPSNSPTASTQVDEQTDDALISIDDAFLFKTDFEDGNIFGLSNEDLEWAIRSDGSGNSYYCNLAGEDWTSFLFGMDKWKNYSVSLLMRFDPSIADQYGEIYIRINREVDGYRVGIDNKEWASISYYPPSTNLAGSAVDFDPDMWVQLRVQVYDNKIEFWINNELIITTEDDRRSAGRAGVGASPGTQICIDEIHVWALNESGELSVAEQNLVVIPRVEKQYSIQDKIYNRPTVPVFYPWSGNCAGNSEFYFDCDTEETPYSLVWTASGINRNIDSLEHNVDPEQTIFMRADPDTLYLISEEWHYWNTNWRYLSTDSKYFLEETFQQHINSEYGDTKMINFEHYDWPDFLGQKAATFKRAGFDGMMLDWWHDHAGNGRSEQIVRDARLEIIKSLREAVGDDFILMGNVGWSVEDPTAPYLSGVFLELWNLDPSQAYRVTYSEEDSSAWDPSIERMEDLLIYWDQNLAWPRVIGFEPFKVTTDDYIEDRYSAENYQYAKLYAAMAVVIPENGYILYADHNDDWDGGDHQHAYYDFYLTDLGKPTSGMIRAAKGVAYKVFENGLVLYNRTDQIALVELNDGREILIEPLSGLFLSDDD